MDKNELYMLRCLQLAKLAAGYVAPNPLVGAVLVHNARIIGEGYHKKFGGPHAEVNCINSVKEEDRPFFKECSLYVSLEPCVHFGKTPPCTDLIIKNKIARVVIGCEDVYKKVSGNGIGTLQEAGIEIIYGVLEKECIELNKRFFTFHIKQRPYIILKWSESADKKIGIENPTGSSYNRMLISNEFTNRQVHKWRSEEQAILVGKQTALKDDPSLTTRLWTGENAIRCVIDSNLSLPPSLKIFDKSTPTFIFNGIKNEDQKNISWIKVNSGDLSALLSCMYEYNIQSLIVEGGAILLQSFIDAGLWDEARVIRNEEMTIENGINAPELKNATLQKKEKYFSDTISYFLPSS